ncbi:hypothetical protein AB0P36_05450 [Streptomyces flavidovirens]|uniref:hypothetical protein n=1 Tax=Streptomyces flavidovirens TaxID=67298 RepID=UPI003421B050
MLLALTSAGCGWSDGVRPCTLIGGVPGISVVYEPAEGAAQNPTVAPTPTPTPALALEPGPAPASDPAVFRLCVDGRCVERTEASATATPVRMSVRTADDVHGEKLSVRFSVTSVEGRRVIMDDTADVRMTESWPNGKECDKEVTWSASLDASPETGLRPFDRR